MHKTINKMYIKTNEKHMKYITPKGSKHINKENKSKMKTIIKINKHLNGYQNYEKEIIKEKKNKIVSLYNITPSLCSSSLMTKLSLDISYEKHL